MSIWNGHDGRVNSSVHPCLADTSNATRVNYLHLAIATFATHAVRYAGEAMPAHAPGELDAARGEPIASLDELRVLVDKVDAFNDPGGVAPLSDCFADLTAGGTTPTTLGAFLDKFSVEEISRRRAEVDPEYAAEQRAAQARVLVAAKRAEEAAKKEQEVGEKCLHSLFLLHSSVLLDCRRFSASSS